MREFINEVLLSRKGWSSEDYMEEDEDEDERVEKESECFREREE